MTPEQELATRKYRMWADAYISAQNALNNALRHSDRDIAEAAADAFLAAEREYLAAKAEVTRLQAWARPHWNHVS